MKTIDEMSTAILEAEGVRTRHDGVHQMASYLMALTLCRDIKGAVPDLCETQLVSVLIRKNKFEAGISTDRRGRIFRHFKVKKRVVGAQVIENRTREFKRGHLRRQLLFRVRQCIF